MYLAYSLLLTLGLLVLIPHFLVQALAHGKYIAGLRQRFGGLPQLTGTRPIIWLHCVSVGEAQAARPLVERLKKEFPRYSLVISTITLTGQNLAQDIFRIHADHIFYFPFDWRWCVRRALTKVEPAVVLIMETELWPNFLRECKSREIPVALVNGRISGQSFRRYSRIKFFLSRVLSCLSLAIMQSESDAARLQSLGITPEKLFTAGNLKFDVGTVPTTEKTEEIRERFDLKRNIPLVLAASTHAPEEKIILDSVRELCKTNSLRLMLAPRHPERFQEVASLIQSSGLTWSRRTNPPATSDRDAVVILLDTIGELPAVYSFAAVVFVGGSIVDRGGHNVLEPAAAGAAVVTGAHTHNFQAIIDLLNEAQAIVQLPPLEDRAITTKLTETVRELLGEPQRREKLGHRAKGLVIDNQGAADRTISLIEPLFSSKPVESSSPDSLLATHANIP